ncbi:hypothetical protein B0H16DRAFT_1735196 [Mycena metata]|uniref:Uncharacterized protein n=1 Tax=Mycena metata TaxID=1033252 RepID=A0AAD7HSM8_9AGAR|nr:hypothetical protein B0H16DRAFT_1735196 [Mycena metata]
MSSATVITLSPAAAVFVHARTTTLGPWIVFSWTITFFRTRTEASTRSSLRRYYRWLVIVVVGLSMLKTAQCIGVVWVKNVLDYAYPDAARLLVTEAWWQLANILAGNAKAKVMWLLVHLVSAFIADLLICGGTVFSLRQRTTSGLGRTTALVNRLLRLVFESAFPPAFIATIDLILTQTLGPKLLWHLFINAMMASAQENICCVPPEVYSYGNGRNGRTLELAPRAPSGGKDQILVGVETQVATHISTPMFSPAHNPDKEDYFTGHEGLSSSGGERYAQ